MNVLIISVNRSLSPVPVFPFGACLVAEAADRAGHSVDFLDLMFSKQPLAVIRERLRTHRYDVIGLSIRNIDNNDLQATQFYIPDLIPVVEAIRKISGARIVLGGAALFVMPEQILRTLGLDCAVVGNGETIFPRLLTRIGQARSFEDVPGVAWIRDDVFTLNPEPPDDRSELNVPSYERWIDVGKYRSRLCTVPLQTKLGCQFRCVYCTYPKIEGQAYRCSDPAAVAVAAARLISSGLPDIEFVDNVFNAPRDHAFELCEALIRDGVRARFQSLELNPAYFSHELIAIMERAGFVGMGMTVESASDPVLYGLGKGFTAREVYRASQIVRAHGLPCVWIFMLGGPGETRQTVRETIRFAERHVLARDAVFFNIGIRIYPGTGIEAIARKQGVLTKSHDAMLEPVFYMAPGLDSGWVRAQVLNSMSRHFNFMSIDSFSFRYLSLIHRIAYPLGIGSPLWRYTRYIRRGLRSVGVQA